MIIRHKAQLRLDAKYDIQSAVANAVMHIIKDEPIYRSCLNCEKFDEPKELCKLCNQRPPAKIIAYACPKWTPTDEEIPF